MLLGGIRIDVNDGDLQAGVEGMHHCHAQLVQSMPVTESFQGKVVWQGIVHVFNFTSHSAATRAYAWSSPIEGSTKRRFYAVLHVPPIGSAADAVRAAIVADYRGGR
jgi:hypothetical protein